MVEIIRISGRPLTTPDCPDSTPLPRRVCIRDRITTLYAEAALWNALDRIARDERLPLDHLCAGIAGIAAPAATFAQAARYFVFDYIAEEIPDDILPPELLGLRRHGYDRRNLN
jgi:predicted DNA-binding ribbon-helix-helix protein